MSRLLKGLFLLVAILGIHNILLDTKVTAAASQCYTAGGSSQGVGEITRGNCGSTYRYARCRALGITRAECPPLPPNICVLLVGGTATIRGLNTPDCEEWRNGGGDVPDRPSGGGGGGGGGGGTTSDFEIDNPERDDNLDCSGGADCLEKNSLVALLKAVVQFFSVVIGVIITAIIVWAGFTYARAGGNQNTTAEAKNRIKNAIIALAVFIFLEALLNWAIPGMLF